MLICVGCHGNVDECNGPSLILILRFTIYVGGLILSGCLRTEENLSHQNHKVRIKIKLTKSNR